MRKHLNASPPSLPQQSERNLLITLKVKFVARVFAEVGREAIVYVARLQKSI